MVDDGSTDGSGQILREHEGTAKLKIFYQENHGVSYTFNRCLQESRGRYVVFLCSDDILYPEHLANGVRFLKEKPGDRIVYSRVSLIDGAGAELPAEAVPEFQQHPSGNVFRQLLQGNFIPFQSVVAERSLFQEFGGFDETVHYVRDGDLWLRMSPTVPIAFQDRMGVRYRWHGRNQSNLLDSIEKHYLGHKERLTCVSRTIARNRHLLGSAEDKRLIRHILYAGYRRLAKYAPTRRRAVSHYLSAARYRPQRVELYVKALLVGLGARELAKERPSTRRC